MNKKRKIDFIIKEDKFDKIVFRFYPRLSSCHSFGDEPPKSWNNVYKVYYYYKILNIYKEDSSCEVLFDSGCDECSRIQDISAVCKHLSEGKTEIETTYRDKTRIIKFLNNEFFPLGDGISWLIKEYYDKDYFAIEMFRKDGVGYRFFLSQNEIKQFGMYLNKCCEYMLAHGDPI
jgi:hypothetical protein